MPMYTQIYGKRQRNVYLLLHFSSNKRSVWEGPLNMPFSLYQKEHSGNKLQNLLFVLIYQK